MSLDRILLRWKSTGTSFSIQIRSICFKCSRRPAAFDYLIGDYFLEVCRQLRENWLMVASRRLHVSGFRQQQLNGGSRKLVTNVTDWHWRTFTIRFPKRNREKRSRMKSEHRTFLFWFDKTKKISWQVVKIGAKMSHTVCPGIYSLRVNRYGDSGIDQHYTIRIHVSEM
jgi:hypothetical protein